MPCFAGWTSRSSGPGRRRFNASGSRTRGPNSTRLGPVFDALNPDSPAFWYRLGTAILCGGIIGLERQLRGKAAGIRTSILICLGTELSVSLGASFQGERVDPTRVLAQVVSGIGFLGGGVILAREGAIVGVTSAAVIWGLAALRW